MSILQGIVCANITPFDADKNVDYESVRTLARYLADSGVHAVYPLGTNGEGLTLSLGEREKIAEIMVEEIAGRIPVVIQCGTQTLEETNALVTHAKRIGADAAGVLSPFFFHQSDQALIEYYSAILETAGSFPVYIYNIPSNTNNDVNAGVVGELAKRYQNLCGVKFSYPDIMRICEYVKARPGGLDTLIGCDKLIYPAYKSGAVGTVTGPAAIFPEIFTSLWELAVSGEEEAALKLQYQIQNHSDELAKYQEIPMIKQYLKSIGVIRQDVCRAPFYEIQEQERNEISAVIAKIQDEFRENQQGKERT